MASAKIFVIICLQSIFIQYAFCQFISTNANANSVIENAMGVANGLGLARSNFASASGIGMAGNLAGSNFASASGIGTAGNLAGSNFASASGIGTAGNLAGTNLNLAGSNLNLAGSNLASQGLGLIENLAESNLVGSNLAGSNFANNLAPGLLTPATLAGTSSGVFTVTSYSPLVPYGLTVTSDNMIEGIVSVNGQLPFLSAVAFEASLPSTGQGVTTCGCGNGEIGITSEVLPSALGLGRPGFGNGLGLGRFN